MAQSRMLELGDRTLVEDGAEGHPPLVSEQTFTKDRLLRKMPRKALRETSSGARRETATIRSRGQRSARIPSAS